MLVCQENGPAYNIWLVRTKEKGIFLHQDNNLMSVLRNFNISHKKISFVFCTNKKQQFQVKHFYLDGRAKKHIYICTIHLPRRGATRWSGQKYPQQNWGEL